VIGALRGLVERVVREAEPLLRRRGLDARPEAEPERRGQARPRSLLVGAVVVGDQHAVVRRDVTGERRHVGSRTAERGAAGCIWVARLVLHAVHLRDALLIAAGRLGDAVTTAAVLPRDLAEA